MTRLAVRADTRAFLRRFMQAGFWFFLIKGLLWIALPAIAMLAGWQLDLL